MRSCSAVKCWLCAGICVAALAGSFADGVPTQQKVDEIVANEIVLFVHNEDVEIVENRLKSQGVTDEMLGSAYLKVVRKKKLVEARSYDGAILKSAMWGLSQHGTENQLTNLLYVAENATDEITVRSAVFFYHIRKPRSPQFLDWAHGILRQPARSRQIKSNIWSWLERDIQAKECTQTCRSRILQMARESLAADLYDPFYPDRILAAHDVAYRTSAARRKMAERVLSRKDLNDVVRRHFGTVAGKDAAK